MVNRPCLSLLPRSFSLFLILSFDFYCLSCFFCLIIYCIVNIIKMKKKERVVYSHRATFMSLFLLLYADSNLSFV
ncbi:hypothetical protein V8B55DRAFT_1342488 [Mucor lusitanicus]|uniref:Uncharacterized protein n=1 Tax=Mucor circinelloides f. lusitanicus TaxID=29924 RepID=A0A8H4BEB1_MUCCL|nr:hypothetical protein FB192DRAFT_1388918 [Mucor lusitanicus]